jgi:hypothetical protein
MEIPSLRVAQHFIDEVYRVLDLTVGVRLPPFDDDCCTERVRKKFCWCERFRFITIYELRFCELSNVLNCFSKLSRLLC